jgi:uncharacterized protein (TIGR01244 family)
MKRLYVLLLASLLQLSVFAANNNAAPFESEINAEIVNYNRVSDKLITSGTPSNSAYKELVRHNVKTIIDLRHDADEVNAARKEVVAAGGKFYNIPIYSRKGISPQQVQRFTTIYENARGPVLVNCGSGNRVGGLWAAYQISKGFPADAAFAEGRQMGLQPWLELLVRETYAPKKNNF